MSTMEEVIAICERCNISCRCISHTSDCSLNKNAAPLSSVQFSGLLLEIMGYIFSHTPHRSQLTSWGVVHICWGLLDDVATHNNSVRALRFSNREQEHSEWHSSKLLHGSQVTLSSRVCMVSHHVVCVCVCVNQQCLLSNLKYLFLTSDVCFFSTTVKITAVIVPLRTCQYITRSWVVFGWSLVPSYTPSTGTDKTWKKILKKTFMQNIIRILKKKSLSSWILSFLRGVYFLSSSQSSHYRLLYWLLWPKICISTLQILII